MPGPARPLSSSPFPFPAPALRRRRLLAAALGGAGALALSACGGGSGGGFGMPLPPAPAPEPPPPPAPAPAVWRMPAETEPQSAVMLASISYDYKQEWSIVETQARMIAELVQSTSVVYLVNDDAESSPERAGLTQALQALGVAPATLAARLQFLPVQHEEFWVRDYGGIFLSDGQGGKQVVDFDFDGYGYNAFAGPETRAAYDGDNDLAVRLAEKLTLPSVRSPLVCEGGNLHFNGKGTVIAVLGDGTEGVGLLGRNPGWTAAQIEAELKRVFDLRKVIFLPRNMPTDAHTVMQTPYPMGDGRWAYNVGVTHIDEMVAWVDERTLLLPEVTADELAAAKAAGDPVTQIAYDVLKEAEAILAAESDQDGQPLKLVRVPEPGPILVTLTPEDNAWWMIADLRSHPVHKLRGEEKFANEEPVDYLLPASYMNFLVADGVVLVPRFYLPGRDESLQAKDEAFRQIIAAQYPGRRVVQINADAILAGGGGMHCISQQIPV